MKKFFLFLLSLTLTMGAFSGCNIFVEESSSNSSTVSSSGSNSSDNTSEEDSNSSESSSEAEKASYSVVFKQEGKDDIVRQVQEGGTLTDIPTPAASASILVAIAIVSITLKESEASVHSHSSSLERDSLIILPPMSPSRINAIQWSTASI